MMKSRCSAISTISLLLLILVVLVLLVGCSTTSSSQDPFNSVDDDENLQQVENVDYDEHEDEEEEIQPVETKSRQTIKSSVDSFREYQSLLINDVQIDLDYWSSLGGGGDGDNTNDQEKPSLLVHYKDDVQFECNIPKEKLTGGGYDWSLNGKYLTHNDSVYSIILDRNIDKELKVLNFSCHFITPTTTTTTSGAGASRGRMVSLQFPLLEISDYYFQGGSVPYQEYLLFKYRRQLKIINIGIVVILFFGITLAVIAWINRSILNKKDQNNLQYVLAPSSSS